MTNLDKLVVKEMDGDDYTPLWRDRMKRETRYSAVDGPLELRAEVGWAVLVRPKDGGADFILRSDKFRALPVWYSAEDYVDYHKDMPPHEWSWPGRL